MRFIQLEQGTPEWLLWRRSRICASDIAAIMGKSPFTTPNQIWRQKVIGVENPVFGPAVQRGKDLEPAARACAEEKLGYNFEPLCVESEEFPRYGASLDGYDPVEDLIIEIKCPGEKTHAIALRGEVPDYYYLQMQWQLLVTGAKKAVYFSFAGLDGASVWVDPDPMVFSQMRHAADKFLVYIDNLEEPPLSDKDWDDEKSEDWIEIANEYRALIEQQQQIEYEIRVRKTRLEELAKGRVRIRGGGIKYYQSIRQGSVDYNAFLQHIGADVSKLATYRKPPIVTTNVRIQHAT